MTCTRCGSSRIVSLSSYAGGALERLCATCRPVAGRALLAAACMRAGRWHMAARLRGERCATACAACDAEMRGAA